MKSSDNAQKQPYDCVALRYFPFTIRNKDCAVFVQKNKRNFAHRQDFLV